MTERVLSRPLPGIPRCGLTVDELGQMVGPDGSNLVWARSVSGAEITATGDAARALADLLGGSCG